MNDRIVAVGVFVAAVLFLIVWTIVIMVSSRLPTAIELFVPVGVALVAGVIVRRGSTGRLRRLGSFLVILGVASLIAVVGLLWLLLNGLGRPY